jgi:hypothetical protein
MTIASIIAYISIFFWIFPAIRQYKSNYFYYFLILALSDPINIFSGFFLGVTQGWIHSFVSLLLFYSINTTTKTLKKYILIHTAFMCVFIVALFFVSNLLYVILILHLLIIYKFIRLSILNLHLQGTLNAFHLVLIFYEVSVIINLMVFITTGASLFAFYYITLTFQIFVAIFFTIFREGNSLLHFKLKTSP